MKTQIKASLLERIDCEIRDAVGRIMSGSASPNDDHMVGDLTARRVEITKPRAFDRLEAHLKMKPPHPRMLDICEPPPNS